MIYETTFLPPFDTVAAVKGTAADKDSFDWLAGQIHNDLQRYHRLFDVYNDYEEINNIKTINNYAGILLILVEPELIGFLKDCVYYQELTSGRVNLAMESVLSLWHEIWSKVLEDSFSTCLLAFC